MQLCIQGLKSSRGAECVWRLKSIRLQVLAPFNKEINVNAKVKELYISHLLPGMTSEGDDNNYGSSAMYDVLALQVRCTNIHRHCHSLI